MYQILRESWSLANVKSQDRKGMTYKGKYKETRADGVYKHQDGKTLGLTPHPDFFKALDELRPILLEKFLYGLVELTLQDKKFNLRQDQKREANRLIKIIHGEVRVTGASLNAAGTGITITGVINGHGVSTKVQYFTNEETGPDLLETWDKLQDQVWAYAYEDKIYNPPLGLETPVEKPEGDEVKDFKMAAAADG